MSTNNKIRHSYMSTKLTGMVENIVYSNSETFFSVLEIDVSGEMVTVVGELAGTAVGEEIVVYGEYVTHPLYGVQFKSEAAERTLPSDATAIYKYLSGGALKGIGPALARRLVDAFGEETLEVLANRPDEVAKIRGFSKEKAAETVERFNQIFGLRRAISELAGLGLNMRDSIRLYKDFGQHAAEVIQDNPYMLCGYPLYKDFNFSDTLAAELGFGEQELNRIRAGLIFILRHNMFNGHTCLPRKRLVETTCEFLQLSRDEVDAALTDSVDAGLVKCDSLQDEDFVFLPQLFRSENYIAERLALLDSLEYHSAVDTESAVDMFEHREGIVYGELQRKAILQSLISGALVITGGPGTGKTTAINAIISLCEQQGDSVSLAAPTGRAAKRMAELTRREAKTIHRLLEVDYRKSEEINFIHDEHNMLKCDVVVVDEMSMVEVSLFESLLRGLRPQCRIIMVGDSSQLPAVGAGNLLRDIIDSGCCEVVEFKTIFRQAAESGIVLGAHSIVEGKLPDLNQEDSDFSFIECRGSAGHALIAELVGGMRFIGDDGGPFGDIQVLAPQRKGWMGIESLNEKLRSQLNPMTKDKHEVRIMGRLYREGDRVMQVRNNYDIEYRRPDGCPGIGIFNGDIGRILRIDAKEEEIDVEFDDDRTVTYNRETALELEPAYAVTVHKSQGSEFSVVIVALSGTPGKLRYRNLLYTAVTRAKDKLIIVGDKNVVTDMVNNDRKSLRHTALKTFIERRMPKNREPLSCV